MVKIKNSLQTIDLIEDKYTDDEDSTDSSDSETKISRKYRKKRFKGNANTFNISPTSSKIEPFVRSF